MRVCYFIPVVELWQKQWMMNFAKKYDIKSPDSWYSIKGLTDKLIKMNGSSLLSMYSWSPYLLLSSIYPNETWDKNKFKYKNKWTNQNQEDWLNQFASNNQIHSVYDWYHFKGLTKAFRETDGAYLLEKHHFVDILLSKIYPFLPWRIYLFHRSFMWKRFEDVRNYLDYLGMIFKLNMWKDWYNISYKEIESYGSFQKIKFKKLQLLLCYYYPEYLWKIRQDKSSLKKKARQRILKSMVLELTPNVDIFDEVQVTSLTN